jgi:hypothetical protein
VDVSGAAPTFTVSVLSASAVAGQPPALAPGTIPSCTAADSVLVQPGGGALVRALSGAGVGSTEYLVTESGVKYPLPSADVAQQLGYTSTAPEPVPSGLLMLLPTGPSLDPTVLAAGGISGPAAQTGGCNTVSG